MAFKNHFIILIFTLTNICEFIETSEELRTPSSWIGSFFSGGKKNPPEAADHMLQEVIRLFDLGKLYDAIRCCDELIEKYPSVVLYHAWRGKCYLKFMLSVDAYKNVRKVFKMEPNVLKSNDGTLNSVMNEDLLADLARLLLVNYIRNVRYSFPEALIWCCNTLIETYPSNPEYYAIRGICHVGMKKNESAISDLEQLDILTNKNEGNTQISDENYRTYLRRVILNSEKSDQKGGGLRLSSEEIVELADLFMSKNLNYSLRVFDEAIRRDPTKASYYKLRADCYKKMKIFDSAKVDLKIWLQYNPDDEDTRIELKTLFLDRDTQTLLDLGFQYLNDNSFKEALDYFERVLNKNLPTSYDLCYEKRGICHWKLNNSKAAIMDLEKAVELAPWDLIPQIQLCEVLIDSGNYDRAKEALKEIEKMISNKDISSTKTMDRIRNIHEKLNLHP